ncbi:MAG: hypothetical protein QHC90_23235 [Shinella sp.]|nr:hypothetical protein [Shinella sp.]
MNMHAPVGAADRTLLPRGLIARRPARTYRFRMGSPVLSGGEVWVVIDRQRSFAGRELYTIFRPRDDRPFRMVLGSFLEPAPVRMRPGDLRRLLSIAIELKGPDEWYLDDRPMTPAERAARPGLMARWSSMLADAFRRGLHEIESSPLSIAPAV